VIGEVSPSDLSGLTWPSQRVTQWFIGANKISVKLAEKRKASWSKKALFPKSGELTRMD